MTPASARFAAVCAPALLAASAIAHATGAHVAPPALVLVGDGPAAVATGFTAGGGRVVTVAHAVPAGVVTVRGADGVARRATVVRRDARTDLALLAVPGLPGGGRVPVGAAGGPAGVRVLRSGRVATLRTAVVRHADATVRAGDGRVLARRPVIELRAPIRSGDSGAPLLDARGRVAGVVFARSRERGGVGYAVDASALGALLR